MLNTQAFADRSAISLSVLCALHCLLFPLAIFLYPNFISVLPNDETFHFFILFIIFPVSVFALFKGAKIHKNPSIIIIGVLGILTLVLALTLGHDVIGDIGEKILTLIGSILVIVAHVKNYSFCFKGDCDCYPIEKNEAN